MEGADDKLTVEGARKVLTKQEEQLLKTREMIQQQLAVLKAEEVTIQRLIATHSNPKPAEGDTERETTTTSTFHSEPDPENLPELNLDTQTPMGEASRSSNQEYDSEDEDEED